jgi:hypothetical protein
MLGEQTRELTPEYPPADKLSGWEDTSRLLRQDACVIKIICGSNFYQVLPVRH